MIDFVEIANRIMEEAVAWFPRLTGGLSLLLLGWLCAVFIRFLAHRLFRGLRHIVTKRFSGLAANTLPLLTRAEMIFPIILYWFILLFFAAAAVEAIGLPILTAGLGQIINYIPRIFLALIIIFGGWWAGAALGNFTARALENFPHRAMAGRLAQVFIIVFSIVLAINQVGVDLSFLTTVTSVILAGLLFAAALAFGLGARDLVSNVLSAHYVRKMYRPGQEVEVAAVRGTIVEITDTFVLIESANGRVAIPAKVFVESISICPKKNP